MPYRRCNVADVSDVRPQLGAMHIQKDMRICQGEDQMRGTWPLLTQRHELLSAHKAMLCCTTCPRQKMHSHTIDKWLHERHKRAQERHACLV